MGVRLSLDEVALLLKVLHQRLAALIAVHPVVLSAVFVDVTVVGDDADDLKVVAKTHLKVVRIVCGRHLDSTGAEADLAVFVAHNGDLTVHDRQDAGLADEVLELFVLGVNGNAGIAHHRLGTGGGDDNIAAAVGERIADMPEVPGLVDILDLSIGKRGQAVRTPVDDAASLVDESLVVQLAEGLAHGAGAAFIHREAGTAPVAARAHFFLLLDDAVAVLFLPLPHAL